MSFGQFISSTFSIITFQKVEGTRGDLYIHLLSFFVGSILQSPKLFFVFVSFIYAYFYSGTIFLLVKHIQGERKSLLLIIFLAIFILWKSIEGINTVRTWTAMWILLYGSLHFLVYRKIKFLFLILLPPFIHFSYFLMAIPAWLVLSIRKIPKLVVLGIYSLSFVFTFGTTATINYIESTELGESRRGYVLDSDNERMVEKRGNISDSRTQGSFYVRFNELGFQRIGFVLVVLAFFLIKLPKYDNDYEFKLLYIGMLNISLANYLNFIFALHTRSIIIGEVFILSFVVIFLAKRLLENGTMRRLVMVRNMLRLSLIFLLPFIVYRMADLLYFVSVFLIAFPFVPWIAENANLSIR
jgi:hypothetical protein